MPVPAYTRAAELPRILKERIVVLDGAMGTMIQRHRLSEADYRGERFKDHPSSLKGNNELLQITRPDVIRSIHEAYLQAGADIVETNTFGATSVAQADYDLSAYAREMNVAGARLAREAVDAEREDECRRERAQRRGEAEPVGQYETGKGRRADRVGIEREAAHHDPGAEQPRREREQQHLEYPTLHELELKRLEHGSGI